MRTRSTALLVFVTLLLAGGAVAMAMGVLHSDDRFMYRHEISKVSDGTYTVEAYRCAGDCSVRHYVYFVECDGTPGYSRGDQLVYIYDSRNN